MSTAMPSSLGEVLLLVKKWLSESSPVVMLQTFMCPPAGGSELMSGIFFRSTGRIARIEESTGTFTFFSSPKDFVMVSPTGCIYGYDANYPLPPNLAKLIPPLWDSLVLIRFPNDAVLIIFAL
ncbi:MAG TPA: hypothetical protein VFF64_25155 [Candidatus Eremiobacteraceae bacterium]|nr:hypothetical protein [Candidatus Eremiobacteraceae bacterium]